MFSDYSFLFHKTRHFTLPDFGLDNLIEMKNQTNFPWLMSNVVDCETGKPLADGEIYHVIKWGDRKIGLVTDKTLFVALCWVYFLGCNAFKLNSLVLYLQN